MSESDPASRSDRATPRGGLVHAYQKYDPKEFPPPLAPPPDLTGAAFAHMLRFGSMRRLTDEELARAVRLDPSMIAGLGPSLDAIRELLEERKRRILSTYETDRLRTAAAQAYERSRSSAAPPSELREAFERAAGTEQLRDLERMQYRLRDDRAPFARELMGLIKRLGDKYQVEALASKYPFTGRTELSVPEALEVKEELETIDRLLAQLEEARKTAQIGIVDLDALAEFVDEANIDELNALNQQVNEFIRAHAEAQGLERDSRGSYQLSPRAYALFQGRLLTEVFASLQASRSGRHAGPIAGEGVVELARTRPYEFGDSAANMDVAQSFINAYARLGREAGAQAPSAAPAGPAQAGARRPPRLTPADIEIHRTRNSPKCATAVILDMSGSMRHDGLYVAAKRMALALDGLIRREYPGDMLAFIEMASVARVCRPGEIVELMPKPVTIHAPMVRLKVDMSDPRASEAALPPHFTNIQHALLLARRQLGVQSTPNRQIMLITDGLPTAHFAGKHLFLLYPPDPLTEDATMREARACVRDGITINVFLLPNWMQSSEDVQFAHRMAEATRGRVFFTGGGDLDRFVLWDYVSQRRKIIA